MSRIEEAIRAATRAHRTALIPFLTAGDPSPGETSGLVAALAEAGADVVELGVPFSDPVADGPAIQRASERALASGTTLAATLEIVREVRRRTAVPLVLFSYLNPLLALGVERLSREAPRAGVDGLLIVDLPVEEEEDLGTVVRRGGLDTIQLVSPTSGVERIARIAAASRGFVYCISRTGVTGARPDLAAGLHDLVARVRAATSLPVAVGFGISTPEQARTLAPLADAVVIGSALVETIAAAPSPEHRLEVARGFLASIREALAS